METIHSLREYFENRRDDLRRIGYCTGFASLPLEIDISSVMIIYSVGSLFKIITLSVGCFSVLLRHPSPN